MRVAVSNIAWPADRDDEVAERLARLGVAGIEVAPTKLWPAPIEATDAQIDATRVAWEARGLPIVAAQALLFGQPTLTLFDDPATRGRTFAYLAAIVRVCGRLGAGALVFGSPKNRLAGTRDRAEVTALAVDFFGRLAEVAEAAGTAVVIEANPAEYGADYLTRSGDALALVRSIDRPGCRLHLDSACLHLAGEDPAALAPDAPARLAHTHASDPFLAPLGTGGVDHDRFASWLRTIGYTGWVSVEMKSPDPFTPDALTPPVHFAMTTYG